MTSIESQHALIKAHLLRGEHITPMDALRLYGCFRLGGRIYDLRREGLKIRTTIIEWNGKRFAEYSLINE